MSRVLAALTAFLTLALTGSAQPQPGEPVALTLHPAAPPKPSLKYRLLPDRRDQQPGNAATLYYRALAMFVENPELLKEVHAEDWETWRTLPLKELPRLEVRDKLNRARHLLAEFDLAAQKRDCDWQLEGRPEGIGLLLPDLQGYRHIAIVLVVRARMEIAEGQFDRALRSLQSGYALAHRLGTGPTVIHLLVGAGVASLMNAEVEELIQQPGAPNLYWALTALPRPFFDPKAALLEESTSLERTFPWLAQLDKGPMTLEQVQAGMFKLDAILDDLNVRKADRTAQALLFTQALPAAREALAARGVSAEELEKMPAIQVVCLYAYREYREAFEEALKWTYTPEALAEAGYKKAAARFNQATARMDRLLFRGLLQGLSGLTQPGGDSLFDRLYMTVYRQERRVAALRCLEALRLHAAGNDSKWPAALKGVTEAPVPADPVTGKPFEYKLAGGRATLATPRADGKTLPVQALAFELTLGR
jgi:hypothetical protein